MAMHTYSSAVRSSDHEVVLELEILVEDGGVQLDFAVEAAANLLPVGCRFGHYRGSIVREEQVGAVRVKVQAALRQAGASPLGGAYPNAESDVGLVSVLTNHTARSTILVNLQRKSYSWDDAHNHLLNLFHSSS
jgi:hypothetical protein